MVESCFSDYCRQNRFFLIMRFILAAAGFYCTTIVVADRADKFSPLIEANDMCFSEAGRTIKPEESDGFEPGAELGLLFGVVEKKKRLQQKCFISIDELIENIQSKNPVVVDVRPKEKYAEFRIPGSLNVQVYELRKRSVLFTKDVILVNDGDKYGTLENLCRYMREKGIETHILQGGLRSWRMKYGKLEGSQIAQQVLDTISPSEYYLAREYGNWATVFSDGRDKDHKVIKTSLDRIAARFKLDKNWETSILVADVDGEQYHSVMKIVRKLGLSNAYYLEGGVRAYNKYLANQKIIADRKSRPMRVAACKSKKKR